MHPQLATVFDEAENRYLKPEELKLMTQYVASMPERLDAYRSLRDRELAVMEAVVAQLQQEMPQVPADLMERCIKHALLMLRYCGLSLLTNDETLVQRRFVDWVGPLSTIFDTQAIDTKLYQLLNQQLSQVLTPKQMSYLSPSLAFAQEAILSQTVPMNSAPVVSESASD